MLMDLGKPTYEADFEQAFLSDAAEFYKKEAAEFLSQNNAPDYMRKVGWWAGKKGRSVDADCGLKRTRCCVVVPAAAADANLHRHLTCALCSAVTQTRQLIRHPSGCSCLYLLYLLLTPLPRLSGGCRRRLSGCVPT